MLLKNETPGATGDVRVEGKDGVKPHGGRGEGAGVPGWQAGEATALLGEREIAVGYGYCSGQEAVAHSAWQDGQRDVEVILPHGKGRSARRGWRRTAR